MRRWVGRRTVEERLIRGGGGCNGEGGAESQGSRESHSHPGRKLDLDRTSHDDLSKKTAALTPMIPPPSCHLPPRVTSPLVFPATPTSLTTCLPHPSPRLLPHSPHCTRSSHLLVHFSLHFPPHSPHVYPSYHLPLLFSLHLCHTAPSLTSPSSCPSNSHLTYILGPPPLPPTPPGDRGALVVRRVRRLV